MALIERVKNILVTPTTEWPKIAEEAATPQSIFVGYVLIRFGPTSPEAFAEAQDLLVNFRIPHHARPDLWLDWVAVLQIAWVLLSIALVKGTRLFPVLAVPFVLAALLTLAQVATGSSTLALLFPWRVSAVLVPVATTVILSRLVALPVLPLGGPAVRMT